MRATRPREERVPKASSSLDSRPRRLCQDINGQRMPWVVPRLDQLAHLWGPGRRDSRTPLTPGRNTAPRVRTLLSPQGRPMAAASRSECTHREAAAILPRKGPRISSWAPSASWPMAAIAGYECSLRELAAIRPRCLEHLEKNSRHECSYRELAAMGFEAGGLRGSPNWANGQSSLILESASSRKVLTSGFGYHWGSVECDRGKSSRARALRLGPPLKMKRAAMKRIKPVVSFPRARLSPSLTVVRLPPRQHGKSGLTRWRKAQSAPGEGRRGCCLEIPELVRGITDACLRNQMDARIWRRLTRPRPVEVKCLTSKSARAPAGLSSGYLPGMRAPGWLSMPF